MRCFDWCDSLSVNCKSKQNKGNILRETVAYIRLLQQDQARLVTVEQRTRQLYSANRHIIARFKVRQDGCHFYVCDISVWLDHP